MTILFDKRFNDTFATMKAYNTTVELHSYLPHASAHCGVVASDFKKYVFIWVEPALNISFEIAFVWSAHISVRP